MSTKPLLDHKTTVHRCDRALQLFFVFTAGAYFSLFLEAGIRHYVKPAVLFSLVDYGLQYICYCPVVSCTSPSAEQLFVLGQHLPDTCYCPQAHVTCGFESVLPGDR